LKETTMPHVTVKLYPGRTEQQKKRLAAQIVKDVVSILGGDESWVSVRIEDIAPEDWLEQVYRPEILEKPETLYKKPGYSPFA